MSYFPAKRSVSDHTVYNRCHGDFEMSGGAIYVCLNDPRIKGKLLPVCIHDRLAAIHIKEITVIVCECISVSVINGVVYLIVRYSQ